MLGLRSAAAIGIVWGLLFSAGAAAIFTVAHYFPLVVIVGVPVALITVMVIHEIRARKRGA